MAQKKKQMALSSCGWLPLWLYHKIPQKIYLFIYLFIFKPINYYFLKLFFLKKNLNHHASSKRHHLRR
jgi:hypothetical protein